MPRFFVQQKQIEDGIVTVTGDDAHHISRSLRMAVGEHITVCDMQKTEYECELTEFLPDCVRARVLSALPSNTEPPYFAEIYQALPKGDKLDDVIQKAVECGASVIVPFESSRCVARIKDAAGEGKKTERRRRIALEAAKQCGRGIIPQIQTACSFEQAILQASQADLALFCYEGDETEPLPDVLRNWRADLVKKTDFLPHISVVIGSEGGFSHAELERAKAAGMHPIGLGRRILRTETAASFVLACLVYELELAGACVDA